MIEYISNFGHCGLNIDLGSSPQPEHNILIIGINSYTNELAGMGKIAKKAQTVGTIPGVHLTMRGVTKHALLQ